MKWEKTKRTRRRVRREINNPHSPALEIKLQTIGSSNIPPHYCNYRCYIMLWIKYSFQIKEGIGACCGNAPCSDRRKSSFFLFFFFFFNLSSWWLLSQLGVFYIPLGFCLSPLNSNFLTQTHTYMCTWRCTFIPYILSLYPSFSILFSFSSFATPAYLGRWIPQRKGI